MRNNLNRKPSKKLEVLQETVSPDEAAALLETNTFNRKLSRATVDRFTKSMKNGEWHLNGETIKISPEGQLLDGQHRLTAVVKSGVASEFLIAYGVEHDAFITIDTGKNRNAADVLSMSGCTKNDKVMAAAIKKIYYLQNGSNVDQVGNGTKVKRLTENYETLDLYNTLPRVDELVNRACKFKVCTSLLTPSVVAAFYYIFTQKDEDMAEEFFTMLENGCDLHEGHPAATLRNKLTVIRTSKNEKNSPDRLMRFLVAAWNAYREGRDLKGFKAAKVPYTIDDIV